MNESTREAERTIRKHTKTHSHTHSTQERSHIRTQLYEIGCTRTYTHSQSVTPAELRCMHARVMRTFIIVWAAARAACARVCVHRFRPAELRNYMLVAWRPGGRVAFHSIRSPATPLSTSIGRGRPATSRIMFAPTRQRDQRAYALSKSCFEIPYCGDGVPSIHRHGSLFRIVVRCRIVWGLLIVYFGNAKFGCGYI